MEKQYNPCDNGLLIENDHVLWRIFEEGHIGMSIMDSDLRIIKVNQSFCGMLGYAEQNMTSSTYKDISHPDDLESDIISFNKLLNQEISVYKTEKRYIRADNKILWASVTTTAIKNKNDKFHYYLCLIEDITARKENEEKLVQCENKRKFLFDNNPQPMWIFDIESLAFLEVNEYAIRQYGYTQNEFFSMTLKDLCHPGDVDFFLSEFMLNKRQVDRRGEWRHKKKNGEIIYVEISSHLIDYDNRPARLVLSNEITGSKLSLLDLEKQKSFFEQTFIQSSTSTQILDKDGWCLRINPKLSELFGVKPEHIEGRVYNIFNDVEIKRNGIDNILKKVFTDQTIEQWEVFWDNVSAAESQHIKIDQKERKWFFCKAHPIVDHEGNLINVVIQHEDITDRKIAEDILKDREKRYRELFNDAPVGYHELDLEGRIIRVNQTELDMLGYVEHEMQGKYAWEFNSDQEFSKQSVLAKINKIKPLEKDFERIMQRKDGSTFPVLMRDLLLYDQKGTCTGIRTAIQDITDRKNTEIEIKRINKELEELLATKDKFFSIIAHDLRSPFNGILGFSNILKEEAKDLDASSIEQYAGIIYSCSLQVLNLLENLLKWAMVQQGKLPFNPTPINLKELVIDVTSLMNENANLKDISLLYDIPDEMIIHADDNMIKTLVRNLVSNAIKFSSSGGMVKLSAVANPTGYPGQILFSVADNGTGIKPENIKKLFNIGTSIERGTKNEKGTGLGLILCKEFVEKHGGEIWVESTVSQGSTFKFTLPEEIKN